VFLVLFVKQTKACSPPLIWWCTRVQPRGETWGRRKCLLASRLADCLVTDTRLAIRTSVLLVSFLSRWSW